MTGKILRGCGLPSKVRSRRGKGWRTCNATGFVRYAEDYVDDVRQGMTAREFADLTPGFGTHHPQDVRQLGNLDDPKQIPNARPAQVVNYSPSDLQISDREIKKSIQEGRPPRPGH